jgi:phosphonate transport system substrate-binding protein
LRASFPVVVTLLFGPLLLGAAQPAIAADKPTFVFTAIPDQDPTRLTQRFSAVADYLHEKLGVPVRYVPVKDYPAAVTAFVNDEVQMAWFGGFTGVQARAKVLGAKAIAQGVEDKAFKTYFIANVQTGLQKGPELSKDLAGKTFTFGSRSSTSGRVMPEYFIEQRFGKAPDKVFAKVGFSGDHTRTIQLVQSGAYQVGAVDFSVWGLEKKAGHVDESKVRIVWESPPFPDYQWTVRGDVDTTYGEGFTKKLQDALIDAHDPQILGPFARSKFVPADNDEYKPVEEVAKKAGLLN